MSEQLQERFDLGKLVLGYLEEAGSVVMPPEFDIYEILMPDELASILELDEHVRLSFAARTQNGLPDEVVQLGVTHPLVERIADMLTEHPANAQSYIRGVRIDKRGLADLARAHYELPNARLSEVPKTTEEATRHHYLLCNFKVTLIGEEKQEELVAVIMDVQAGHVVDDEVIRDQLAIIDPEPAHGGLPIAPARWQGAGDALAPETLQMLLPRAEEALRDKLAEQTAAQTARMERHLALDLARIGDYYDEMAADLERRRVRLPDDDHERRQGFDDKLALLAAERTQKLDDARGRYRLRIEMELVNVLLATQPKVILPMAISNRTATITRTIVWDPLRRQLESLVCDVCGKPGEGLHLCTGGHLAHEDCLAPQCIDCKREYCRLCIDKVTVCVVCQQPVCRASLVKCSTCGRGTCSEHQQLCHAANGEPATVTKVMDVDASATPSKATPSKSTSSTQPTKNEAPSDRVTRGQSTKSQSTKGQSTKGRTTRRSTTKPAAAAKREPIVKGVRIDIQIYEDRPLIAAFVMRSTNRVLATRSIELTPNGILVRCECEKPNCEADGYFFRPHPSTVIEKQVAEKLSALQQEYLVPTKKVHYLTMRFGRPVEVKRFALPEPWHDPKLVAEAQRGFDELG